ncbi:hypothetical protein FHS27_003310 [Rhodopirellula rubra]|uniref:Uncharacterized protein n=1 Tax=Aporhodopirellula rubra TaxID=980271 RepID=A0A7W5DZS6_9BACT|nr:hypothetical protein [Aporhodopirellula rubra]MBB3207485.1 hypothetical protein [Aporhodopirellula rubra]
MSDSLPDTQREQNSLSSSCLTPAQVDAIARLLLSLTEDRSDGADEPTSRVGQREQKEA